MKCVKWKVLEKLRDKKIYTFYRTLKKGEIYPPPFPCKHILYYTKSFCSDHRSKVRVFGFWFQIAWIFSVNHKGVCSSCYPLANIYCLYIVGFHYGLLHFSWKSFSDERVLHEIHKNSATKHFLTVSISNCSIKMLMIIYHG